MTDDEAESESQSLPTPNPSSFATTIKTHTDLFTTFITKETGKITASYQAKLDLLEAQLKASQEEVSLVKSLRNRDALYYSNLPRLEDLQEQLKASRKEVKAREEENERLCAFMRESNSKSQQEATEQRRKREGIEAELDRLHGEYQWLQRDRLDARTTAESLKRTLADTERSLADQKSLETSLRSSISETNNAHASLAREFAALTESSSKERKCLVDGMKKTETEFTMRLEATMRQSAEHEAKAKEVSAKLETSTGQVRLLVQEIDRLKRESRESTSVITGLQHKVDSSRQEVAYIQDQLTSLRTLHSQTLSDSTQKVERYAQLTVELRDKLSRIMSESESERASTEKQVLRMKHELSSAKTQWKVAEEYARGAERQMDDLFRQLSAAQVEGSRVKESFGKRISSLGDALRHHHLALLVDVDGSDMLLKPTPKLVVLGEKLHQLISNSGCTTLSQIPDKLTQHTEPVIPYLSSLVDQLIWIYNETSANSALAIASSNSDYGLTWKPQDQLLLSSAITDTSAAATVNTNNSATDSRSTPTKFINLTDSITTAVFLNSPSGANIRANSYLSIHQTPISPKSTVAMTLVSKAATAEAGSSTETQTQTQTLLLPRRSLEDLVHPVNVDVTRRILSREAQDTDPSISEGASGRLRETREDVSISTKGASERLNEASEASEPASISTRGTSERSREARDESQCSFVHPDSSLSTEEVHLQESPQAPISTRGVKRAREVRGGVKLDNKIKRPRTSISRQECFAPSSSTTGPSISGDTNSDSAHRPPAPSPAPTGSESTADPSRSAATSNSRNPEQGPLAPTPAGSNDPEQGPPAPTRPSPAPTAGPSNIATASISINENPELINQISTESPSSAVDGTTIPPKRKRGRPRKSNITKSKRTAMAPGSVPPADVLALTEEMERSRELQDDVQPDANAEQGSFAHTVPAPPSSQSQVPITSNDFEQGPTTPTLADPSSSSAAGPGSTDTFLASESQHKPSLTMSLVQASNIDDFELTNQDSTETVNKTTAGPSTDTSSSSDSLPPDASISTARMKRSREVREDVTPDANAKRSRTLPSVATYNDAEQGASGAILADESSSLMADPSSFIATVSHTNSENPDSLSAADGIGARSIAPKRKPGRPRKSAKIAASSPALPDLLPSDVSISTGGVKGQGEAHQDAIKPDTRKKRGRPSKRQLAPPLTPESWSTSPPIVDDSNSEQRPSTSVPAKTTSSAKIDNIRTPTPSARARNREMEVVIMVPPRSKSISSPGPQEASPPPVEKKSTPSGRQTRSTFRPGGLLSKAGINAPPDPSAEMKPDPEPPETDNSTGRVSTRASSSSRITTRAGRTVHLTEAARAYKDTNSQEKPRY